MLNIYWLIIHLWVELKSKDGVIWKSHNRFLIHDGSFMENHFLPLATIDVMCWLIEAEWRMYASIN